MLSRKIEFKCKNCEKVFYRWEGRCDGCNTWNSLVEIGKKSGSNLRVTESVNADVRFTKLADIEVSNYPRISSGIKDLDEILGGGLTQGSLILLGGEPGVGKSTLLMQVLGNLEKNEPVLYVSGEESASQIKQRAIRVNVSGENITLINETTWEKIKKYLEELRPRILVLDSIQTLQSSEINSMAGNASQIREVTLQLMYVCKSLNITCFIIGHITKDGSIAGPKILEHMVDTVMYLKKKECKKEENLKLLKVKKNRFGSCDGVKIIKLTKNGFVPVVEKNGIEKIKGHNTIGRVATILDRTNNFKIIFVESLVRLNKAGAIKRVCHGYPVNRLSLIVAVAEKYLNLDFSNDDIYLSVEEGENYKMNNIDLAVLASIISSKKNKTIPSKTVFLGDIKLTGEIDSTEIISLEKIGNSLEYMMIVAPKLICEKLKKINNAINRKVNISTAVEAKDILKII